MTMAGSAKPALRIVACSRDYHDRLRAFPDLLWQQLHNIGIQHGEDGAPDLSLRNCDRCGSTIAREVT